jgi:regulator of sigma E protease
VPLVVERKGQRVPLTITPTKRTDGGESVGTLDFQPDFGNWPVVVDSVSPGMPAAEAGLQAGDRLLAVNDTPVRDPEQVTQLIQEYKSAPIRLTVERKGERKEITASVRRGTDGREILGFRPTVDAPLERAGLASAFAYSVRHNIEVLRLTGKALGQFVTGQRSARDTVSGPIGIMRASSMAVNELGWAGVFGMLAFLSLNLGVFNLFPIPVLDGGAIFLLLIEAVLGLVGITLSINVRERIQQVGFVMVLLLMVFVITNDLMKEASLRRAPDNKPAATQK